MKEKERIKILEDMEEIERKLNGVINKLRKIVGEEEYQRIRTNKKRKSFKFKWLRFN